jgi:hypothetical protein
MSSISDSIAAEIDRSDQVTTVPRLATNLVEASVISLVLVGSSHRLAFGGSALRNLASPRAYGGFLR